MLYSVERNWSQRESNPRFLCARQVYCRYTMAPGRRHNINRPTIHISINAASIVITLGRTRTFSLRLSGEDGDPPARVQECTDAGNRTRMMASRVPRSTIDVRRHVRVIESGKGEGGRPELNRIPVSLRNTCYRYTTSPIVWSKEESNLRFPHAMRTYCHCTIAPDEIRQAWRKPTHGIEP